MTSRRADPDNRRRTRSRSGANTTLRQVSVIDARGN
jgi:hypothetical protein